MNQALFSFVNSFFKLIQNIVNIPRRNVQLYNPAIKSGQELIKASESSSCQ